MWWGICKADSCRRLDRSNTASCYLRYYSIHSTIFHDCLQQTGHQGAEGRLTEQEWHQLQHSWRAGAMEDRAIIVFTWEEVQHKYIFLKINKELHFTFTRWYFVPVLLGTGTQLPMGTYRTCSPEVSTHESKRIPTFGQQPFFVHGYRGNSWRNTRSLTRLSTNSIIKQKLLSWVTSQLKLRGWNYIYIIPIKWSLKAHPTLLPPPLPS